MYVYMFLCMDNFSDMRSPFRICVHVHALVEAFVVVTLLYGIGTNSRVGGAFSAAPVDM